MRLIDADALIEYFSRWLDDEHYVERTFKDIAKEDIIPIIDKAPTIEVESVKVEISDESVEKIVDALIKKLLDYIVIPGAAEKW